MAPKKEAKKKLPPCPPGITAAVWELANTLSRLIPFYSGEAQKAVGEGEANITRAQAAIYLTKILYNGKNKEGREEALKAGIIEIAIKAVPNPDPALSSLSLGMLPPFMNDEATRAVILDSKPNILTSVYNAIINGSGAAKSNAVRVLRLLAEPADSRTRVLQGMRNWDWRPLLDILALETGQQILVTQNALTDVACLLECLASELPVAPDAKEDKDAKGDKSPAALQAMAHLKILESGGIETFVQLWRCDDAPLAAKYATVGVLFAIMKDNSLDEIKDELQAHNWLEPLIPLLDIPDAPFTGQANISACLWLYTMPPGPPPVEEKPEKEDKSGSATPSSSRPQSTASARTGVSASKLAEEAGAQVKLYAPHVSPEAKAKILERIDHLHQAMPYKQLLRVCTIPHGPLPDLINPHIADANVPSLTASIGGGIKAAAAAVATKKKKQKLEPGMAECQTYASAALKMLTLSDAGCQVVLRNMGVRFITPLLSTAVHSARWNAQQMCLNLSSQPGGHNQLTLYRVPEYTINSNLPGSHFGTAVNGYLMDLRAATTSNLPPIDPRYARSKTFATGTGTTVAETSRAVTPNGTQTGDLGVSPVPPALVV